jgi:hypothetical protein
VRPCDRRLKREDAPARCADPACHCCPGDLGRRRGLGPPRRLQQTPRPCAGLAPSSVPLQGAHVQPTCQVFPHVRGRAGALGLPRQGRQPAHQAHPCARPPRNSAGVWPRSLRAALHGDRECGTGQSWHKRPPDRHGRASLATSKTCVHDSYGSTPSEDWARSTHGCLPSRGHRRPSPSHARAARAGECVSDARPMVLLSTRSCMARTRFPQAPPPARHLYPRRTSVVLLTSVARAGGLLISHTAWWRTHAMERTPSALSLPGRNYVA